MDEFSINISKFVEKVNVRAELVIRKIALDMFQRIVLRTPVSTGRLRGNWQVSIGVGASGELELNDKTGTATISAGAAKILDVKLGDTIVFSNTLPYARRVEYGWSKQSPAGMVRVTLRETQQILGQAVKE